VVRVFGHYGVECAADGLLIHTYYFPTHSLGTKRIAYNSIRGLERFDVPGPSKWRIWGTTLPNRWANYDPLRPKKEIGFLVDIGKRVKPFITPDDPDVTGRRDRPLPASRDRRRKPSRSQARPRLYPYPMREPTTRWTAVHPPGEFGLRELRWRSVHQPQAHMAPRRPAATRGRSVGR